MWPYDSDGFDPPAAVLEAVLVFSKKLRASIRMQIDSGADLTCIPSHLVPTSRPIRFGITYVSGYDGAITKRKTVFVSILFGEHRFENIEVLPIESRTGLLGRDLLNALEVTLDGPARSLLIDGQ
jgi:hypothetical protein